MFLPVASADWEARILEDLKGADYSKKLIWQTLEGFSLKPYYRAEDLEKLEYLLQEPGRFPFLRGNRASSNTWQIRQDFRAGDLAATAKRAEMAVELGANAIGFDLSEKGGMDEQEFRNLIAPLNLACVSLNLMAGDSAMQALDFMVRYAEEQDLASVGITGSVMFDWMEKLMLTGGYFQSASADVARSENLLLTAENELPGFRVLPVTTVHLGNAGATIVQELAVGLAMATEYLVQLTDRGHNPGEIMAHMQWNMTAGPEYFPEIARIRAARHLLARLAASFDSSGSLISGIFIHSITTQWNKTLYDPYVNLLRLTTEAMSAVIGGCDSLDVQPFDHVFREPGELSGRLSRNIQIILREESYLNKVIDPASGSYYIEALTDSLIGQAWELFLELDRRGGFLKSFEAGFIQGEIAKTAELRRQRLASRREVLVGTNQFPSFDEAVADKYDPRRSFRVFAHAEAPSADPLQTGRVSAGFEQLRLRTEKHPGKRPLVFMLTIGNLAMRLARSQFACNFFAAAGYQVKDNLGFNSAAEGVEAALKENANLVVVCSSDEEYATRVPEVNDLLKSKAILVVAGAPPCMEELRQAGIDHFIHVRSNLLETLEEFHRLLNIA